MKTDLSNRLEAYLSHQWPHATNLQVRDLWRAPAGSSRVTWLFDAYWEEDGKPRSQGMVMRSGESWVYRDTEVSLEQETRVTQALKGSAVPVASILWYETDPRWFGQPFSIVEKIRGTSSFVFESEERKAKVTRRFVEILATQHTLDWEKQGLSFLGFPDDPAKCAMHQIDLWDRVIKREIFDPAPVVAEFTSWLRRNAPRKASRISMNHGDPGPGNFLIEGDEITAVLDWEQGFLGDPMADLGNLVTSRGKLIGDLDPVFAAYEELSGIPVQMENVKFYAALTLFWGVAVSAISLRKLSHGEIEGIESGFSMGVLRLNKIYQHLGEFLTRAG